jgi:hypothetical protein
MAKLLFLFISIPLFLVITIAEIIYKESKRIISETKASEIFLENFQDLKILFSRINS